MLAGEAGIPFKTFAEPVRPTEALPVAAVGALGPCQSEEDQVAHRLCIAPATACGGQPLSGCDVLGSSRGQLQSGQIGLPASGGRRRGAATRPLPPFALDQRLSKFASVLQYASAVH